jgi:hypothetical protein
VIVQVDARPIGLACGWASLALAATISAAVVLSPVAMAAPGDLPDLEQSAPTNISGGYFDDHL